MKTNKIKKVLIALDYDPTAKKVAEEGFIMAKSMGAEVTLLHIVVDPALYSTAYDNMGAWQIDTANILDTIDTLKSVSRDFLEKTKKHLGAKSIKTIQKEGD